MFIKKNLGIRSILKFSGIHLLWLALWSVGVTLLFYYTEWKWLQLSWQPLSIIGTAVAFYVGFKNNNSYDRLWEARKIWGAIVNDSRTWGINIKGFISDEFRKEAVEDSTIRNFQRKLVLRHIGWLYTLRNQLLIPTSWEHISQKKSLKKVTEKRMDKIGTGLFSKEVNEVVIEKYFDADEYKDLSTFSNMATQIIERQSNDLKQLRSKHLIDDFRHMELQKNLKEFYAYQGKCERIKKFPLPRQYASMSNIFVGIFIFLLPFGVVPEFATYGSYGFLWSIPLTVLISWIFLMMELVGDYSENPFEGLGNDIPMLSLCRTIEIDLLEMIGEKNVPKNIKPKEGILM